MFAGETTGEPGWWCSGCGTLFYQHENAPVGEVRIPVITRRDMARISENGA
jgi:hypothetical protein